VLDFATHRPDMPLYPGGGPTLGLDLWNYPTTELLIEGPMYRTAAWMYFKATRSRDAVGRFAVPMLLALLGAAWLGVAFGPRPQSATVLAWSAMIGWLFFTWAWWGDAHREAA
jgi:hypothetical protein